MKNKTSVQSPMLEELEATKRLLEATFNGIPDVIGVQDNDHNIIRYNEAGYAFLNISPAEAKGKKCYQLIGRQKPCLVCATSKCYRSKQPEKVEKYVPELGIWLDVRAYPILNKDGEVIKVIEHLRDISERKKVEEALKESEKRFRDLANMLPEAVFETDGDLNLIYANHRAFSLFGYAISDLPIGLSGLDFLSQEDRLQAQENISSRLDGTNFGPVEYRFVRKDGSIFPGLFHATYRMKDGELLGLRGIIIDISQRKRDEEQLKASQNMLETILRNMPGGTLLIGEDYRIYQVNKRTCEISGYSEKELIGEFCDIVCPKGKNSRDCPIWEKRQDGFIGMDTALKCKDGRQNPILKNAQVISISGKKYILENFQDITARKLAEAERTRLEEQFNQAQKLESIGRLAGGVAHDLNNLLTPILGYSELLLACEMGKEESQESLEAIVETAKRARHLVSQLLIFSRKQNLEFTRLDLNQLLGSFKSLLKSTIRENIDIQYDFASQLPVVNGDIGQLEQVVMNLVVNAQDAMPEGGKLKIETNCLDLDESWATKRDQIEPGRYVLLRVSDTGCGMDPKTRDHVFEPFFTTKGKEHGTGLGLATVYGIIKQHSGQVEIYSELNLGTTVNIYLPVVEEPVEQTRKIKPPPQDLKGIESIMLVEDNEKVRKLTQSILEKKGYKVSIATSGTDALAQLEQLKGDLDLLLTDVIMPGMNGKQLYLKILERIPSVRVLYMSGYTDDVIAPHGVIEPGVNYIQKPFSINALAVKVREALDFPRFL